MFRSRRCTLVKQLWKFSQCQDEQEETEEEAERLPLHRQSASKSAAKRRQIQTMLKRLKEAQLETLVKAVETKGANPGDCVLTPSANQLHVQLASVFRWPDIHHDFELKRLAICNGHHIDRLTPTTANKLSDNPMMNMEHPNKLYECCNPYHWSRIFKPSKYTIQSRRLLRSIAPLATL
jgi:MAD (mothers against decapentaplegic) family protein 6/7